MNPTNLCDCLCILFPLLIHCNIIQKHNYYDYDVFIIASVCTDSISEVSVFDEIYFNLFGNKESSLIWPEYGLRIHISEGSLYAGEMTYLQVKAILAGCFIVPPDCHMISGIYWICCPEQFQKRVTVHLSHAAVIESEVEALHFRFYAAKCSRGPPHEFKQLEGGSFAAFTTSASIQLKQFSFFGLGAIRASKQQYCYQVFYKSEQPNIEWEMFFVIIKDDPVFQKVKFELYLIFILMSIIMFEYIVCEQEVF